MRRWLANHLMTLMLWIGVPSFIIAKVPFLPKKVKMVAVYGLCIFLMLIFVRLSLLAFGD